MSTTVDSKPSITTDEAREFLLQNWNFLQVKGFHEMVSYEYRTYVVNAECGNYVFKISNKNESKNESLYEAMAHVLAHLEDCNIKAQRMVKSTFNGSYYVKFTSKEEPQPLKSFLMTYLEGDVLANMEITQDVCSRVAKELRKLHQSLDCIKPWPKLFDVENSRIWDLENAGCIKPYIPYIETSQQRQILTTVLDNFEKNVKPKFATLTKGVIHGDPNESNIIINKDQEVSFIDWQDIVYSYKAYDLAILIFSILTMRYQSSSPLEASDIGRCCLQGYILDDHQSLNENDVQVLVDLVQCRNAVSLCIGQYTYNFLNPGNEYLLTTAKHGWEILQDLQDNSEAYRRTWMEAFKNVQY